MLVLVKVVQTPILYGFIKAVQDVIINGLEKHIKLKTVEKSQITSGQAKSKGFKCPKNAQKVPVAPKDMKYKGYTAEYWNKMKFKN